MESTLHLRRLLFAPVLALALIASSLVIGAQTAAAQVVMCGSTPATIVGTNGPDTLIGTPGDDVIAGLGGADVIRGRGGDDIICGGGGRDRLYGGRGDDQLNGGAKRDILRGGAGADLLEGKRGNDHLLGGGGDDELLGGAGRQDRLEGKRGFDQCTDPHSTTITTGCEATTLVPLRAECEGPTTTSFDATTAERMMQHSAQAYFVDPGPWRPGARMDRETADLDIPLDSSMACWRLIRALDIPRYDVQAYIARNVQTHDLVVSFRGSAQIADWVQDLKVARDDWQLPNGQVLENAVHRGFSQAYRSARSAIWDVLSQNLKAPVPGARVYFTGHSLGGAMANLASLDLADDLRAEGYDRNEIVLYTFGAPRAISRELYNRHASLVPHAHAVVNPEDLVPHVPSAIGSNHYSQIPQVTVLNKEGSLVRTDDGPGHNYAGCVNEIPGIGPHARGEYAARLANIGTGAAPSVRLSVDGGNMRVHWSGTSGPCDWVSMWYSTSRPSNPDAHLAGLPPLNGRRWADGNDSTFRTIHNKGDDYWAGYVNAFGEFVTLREYFPTTPRVWLSRIDQPFPLQDDIRLNWSVSDPGDQDWVVLFDENPWSAGPDGGYRNFAGFEIRALATTNSPEATLVNVGSDPRNEWWVAYVQRGGFGPDRILAVSRWGD